MSENFNHNITVRNQDKTGINLLIGGALTFAIFRLWWSGTLEEIGVKFFLPESAAYGSVTYLVLKVLIDLVGAIGTVASFLFTGLFAVISDIFGGVKQLASERETKKAVDQQVIQAAVSGVTKSVAATAGDLAVDRRRVSVDKMAEAVTAIHRELKDLRADRDTELIAAEQARAEIMERIQSIEDMQSTEPAKNATKPRTRSVRND